jgi:hypothetical protein
MSKTIYQEFVSANIIGVTLDHNGLQGGDAGHGGYVTIGIRNMGSTSMEINGKPTDEFCLTIRGDAERETFLAAFKMIVKELENNPTI